MSNVSQKAKNLRYSSFHDVHFCVSLSWHESYWLPPSCLCLSLKNYPLGFLPACARVELVGVQFSAAFSKLVCFCSRFNSYEVLLLVCLWAKQGVIVAYYNLVWSQMLDWIYCCAIFKTIVALCNAVQFEFFHVPEETTVWYWMDVEYICGLKLSLFQKRYLSDCLTWRFYLRLLQEKYVELNGLVDGKLWISWLHPEMN